MTYLESLAITAPLVLLSAVAIWAALHAFGAEETPVMLGEMLARQGADVQRIAVASGNREFALAVRQCLECGAAQRCRRWLDAGEREGYEAFCENTDYVRRIAGLTGTR